MSSNMPSTDMHLQTELSHGILSDASGSELIFITDIEHRITYVNGAVTSRYNSVPVNLIGQNCFDIFGCPAISDPTSYPCSNRPNLSEPSIFIMQSNTLGCLIEASIYPLLDSSGRVASFLHVAREIEAPLIDDYSGEQPNRCSESNRKPTGTALNENVDALIQQSRMTAMGELIRNIVHQWKQPVNTISLIVQSMQLTYLSNQLTKEEFDQSVTDVMDKLHQISDSISEFSTFFSHDDKSGTIYINEAVSRAVFFTEPSLRSKGIGIELNEKCSITAAGSQSEFMQAVIHLILLARDALLASRIEQPQISIGIYRSNENGVVTIGFNRHNNLQTPQNGIPTTLHSGKDWHGMPDDSFRVPGLIIEKRIGGRLKINELSTGIEYTIELNTI